MKTNRTTYKEERERWAREDVLQLANHFHKFTTKNQFERVGKYIMEQDDITEISEKRELITSMKIYLALNEQDINEHTFFPILKVIYNNGTEDECYYKLAPAQNNTNNKSAEVPKIFKEMIHKNWNGIEFNLIDDLFVANKNGLPVRVLEYIITKNVIDDVIKKLNDILGVTFYMGVDMNKFRDKEMISFTPVLGFKYAKTEEQKNEFAIYEALEFDDYSSLYEDFGEVFIEYSRPCPPTCG